MPNHVVAAGMLGVCLLSAWIGVVAGRPFVLAGRMRQENDRIAAKLAGMKMTEQNVRKDVAALSVDAGMEREARRMGYLREGERHLVIPRDSDRR